MKRHSWFFLWPKVAGMKDRLPDWEMNQIPNHSFIHSVHKYGLGRVGARWQRK